MEVIALHSVDLDRFNAEIFADPVRNMNNVVAGFQFGVIGDPSSLSIPAATLQLQPALDFFLRDHRQVQLGQFKTG